MPDNKTPQTEAQTTTNERRRGMVATLRNSLRAERSVNAGLLAACESMMTVYPSDPVGHLSKCPGNEAGRPCAERCAAMRAAIVSARGGA